LANDPRRKSVNSDANGSYECDELTWAQFQKGNAEERSNCIGRGGNEGGIACNDDPIP
jgi:hypothetical protein